MTENEFDLLYEVYKNGLATYRTLAEKTGLSLGYVSSQIKKFNELKYLDQKGITKEGLKALEPYKVKNVILLAAGLSSRFMPISLEKPKGLIEVKGEVLIERQIKQMLEAGIKEIILMLGYKKESFFYLQDKYKEIKIIINPDFASKNTTHTIFLARKYIGNSYISCSDNYFTVNPFEPYVYRSFYSAIHTETKMEEWYMTSDKKGNLKKVVKYGDAGDVMYGNAYWDREFAKEFIKLVELHDELGDYSQNLWEDLFIDNIKKLPPVKTKVYPSDYIFEFDSLADLRKFDEQYVNHTNSKIIKNICKTLKCEEKDVVGFQLINDGLTNRSFIFEVKGKKYVYRHPGEGSEKIIDRKHEAMSLRLGKEAGVDPTFLYIDETDYWKISEYFPNGHVPDYQNKDDVSKVIKVMRKLHDKNLQVDWYFRPWEDSLNLERLTREKGPIEVKDFEQLKTDVEKCYKKTIGDGINPRFCHNDTYAPNWLINDKDIILIDWEYAGESDPGCDTGTFIMDSMYEIDEGIAFIKEYLGKDYSDVALFHHLAYTALLCYYWFVWALYKESIGDNVGEYLHKWYVMAKRYSKYLVETYF